MEFSTYGLPRSKCAFIAGVPTASDVGSIDTHSDVLGCGSALADSACPLVDIDDVKGKTYDYVIVGGGISGLVTANRLSEDRDKTVLIIERGYFDDKPEAILPYYAKGVDESVMMRPRSAPVARLNNQTFGVAVAAVVGGGSGQTGREILFRGLRATGVEIVSRGDGSVYQVFARKEVILAAGAIMTPQLLQASGIGPKSVLTAAGIRVKKDMASVGANFQDHPTAYMSFNLSNLSFPNPTTLDNNATYNATAWAQYALNRTGPIATGRGPAAAFLSLTHITSASTAQSISTSLLAQNAADYLPPIYADPKLLRGFIAQRAILASRFTSNTMSIAGFPMSPSGASPAILFKSLSRGTVTLNLTHPFALPVVQYNTFQNPIDLKVMLAMHTVVLTQNETTQGGGLPLISVRPLSKYPGPLLAKISSLPNFYYTTTGNRHIWIWQCHQIYGHTFRYHPTGLLFSTAPAYRSIYATKSNVRKSPSYAVWARNEQNHNTLTVLGRVEHAVKRKVLNLAFSEKAVRYAEGRVRGEVGRWVDVLAEGEEGKGDGWSVPMNAAVVTNRLVFDIAGNLTFGVNFGLKERDGGRFRDIPEAMAELLRFMYPISQSPFINTWVYLKPRGLDRVMDYFVPKNIRMYYDFIDEQVGKRMKEEKEREKLGGDDGKEKDMFHYMFQQKKEDGNPVYSIDELRAEANLLLIAGSDTTAVTLCAFFFYITRRPLCYEKLTHEIRTTFTSASEIRTGAGLTSCTYLTACVNESLRLGVAGAGTLDRVVQLGGLIIDGEYIPAGTTVACSGWTMMHNEASFDGAHLPLGQKSRNVKTYDE
ncbi:putative sterigmatocystin biosynthesis monooxygenase stcF [Glarea lozoyensis 74030]|uniref:Putative sterigmatocystin biosynthesis monooxygenase stcF n=1 Tax=Glarea lozoyensis (strain ATCC 74030 / MF5533) TaxID=1104152 RepID=H0ET81_GLAL7|nr:putative sterigmatocystin biosynthesis monooxygenase stcF [Glarea lozoyensis 74030]